MLSTLDKLGHADPTVAIKKQKDFINVILKKQWDHPAFKGASTDTSVRLPPKASLNGKPANVIDFEKKSRELSNKKLSFSPLKPTTTSTGNRGNGPRGRGRGFRGRGRGRGSKRRHNFPTPKPKKRSFWCNKCRRKHGHKENFTCPNK